jgi:hypothetical protein
MWRRVYIVRTDISEESHRRENLKSYKLVTC